jgi:hypothetical protein
MPDRQASAIATKTIAIQTLFPCAPSTRPPVVVVRIIIKMNIFIAFIQVAVENREGISW